MAHNPSRPNTTAALLDDEHDVLRATCPMCHTPTSITQDAIQAGGDWHCVRCGQHWDATRLAAVATYAAWVADRDRAGMQGIESSQDTVLYRDSPTERQGGRP